MTFSAKQFLICAALPIWAWVAVASAAETNANPAASSGSVRAVQTDGARPNAKTVTNSIGMAFVAIHAGTFMMGSADSDPEAYDVEKPQHRVTISKPFYIGQHEVTQAQWEAVMGSNPYTLSRSNPFYGLPGMAARITRPDHPATVSWEDAQEFIQRLNTKENTHRYRLPTEAEWEYAARAGTTTAYSFGDNRNDLSQYAWHGEGFTAGGTHPVGQKRPNPWGLYDVHGNVWEWVQDWYAPQYQSNAPVTDPTGPPQGAQRVVRGGSWHVTADSWRSAFRKGYDPDYRGISIGFRMAMTEE
ncbi:MAG TPA: formylglycine-generating enzyme family protein [Xanthomonadaceae bacterium]|nr:formylglycine-generating enzyme family protein [Xanthomonadaceae bacterium]